MAGDLEQTQTNGENGERYLSGSELRVLNEILKTLRDDMYRTDPRSPGLMLRMDRLERRLSTMLAIVQWGVSGGLISLAATILLLYRIMVALGGGIDGNG